MVSPSPAPKANHSPGQLELVSWALVDDNPWQPRTALTDIEGLAENIKRNGLLQPPIVRRRGDRFELLFGHRRKAACLLNGETERMLEVRDEFSDEEMAGVALDEN